MLVASDTEHLEQLEMALEHRLGSRVRNLRLRVVEGELILTGHAMTYHAKQLAQHLAMELTSLVIRANEIEVS